MTKARKRITSTRPIAREGGESSDKRKHAGGRFFFAFAVDQAKKGIGALGTTITTFPEGHLGCARAIRDLDNANEGVSKDGA